MVAVGWKKYERVDPSKLHNAVPLMGFPEEETKPSGFVVSEMN